MMQINDILTAQRVFFNAHQTKSVEFRLETLKNLSVVIHDEEQNILKALHDDLGKSEAEGFLTEVGIVYSELKLAIKNIKKWSRPKSVSTPITLFPARSSIMPVPYGNVLIMAPWNYPFQLCMVPLIGAISAGNTVILKPSAAAPATGHLIARLVSENFPPELIAVVEGGRAENNALFEQRFDYVFFTGSRRVGQVVMEACAQNLTPLTLELGGKSPCIVDETADLKLAAKRIVFGKLINAGQTCVAPDYLLIHETVKEEFTLRLIDEIEVYLNALGINHFPRIVNARHYERLENLVQTGDIRWQGNRDPVTRSFLPVVMDHVEWDDPVMQEEIFGPIFPILTFSRFDELNGLINERSHPLALYLFTKDHQREVSFMNNTLFGGGCINDTVVHLTNHALPFGGVGDSGMGSYHGKASFHTFSHQKSVLHGSQKVDFPFRYPPYGRKKLDFLKKFFQ